MVVLQIINKIIQTSDIHLITENNLNEEMFLGYENEFKFILNHYQKYKKVIPLTTSINMTLEGKNLEYWKQLVKSQPILI